MPFREYEAKVCIADEESITNKFYQLGAILLKQVLQYDCYYDINFKLAKKDQLLRLRTEKDPSTHKFRRGELSWKSGRKGTQYEVRKDISINLISLEAITSFEAILYHLGFIKVAKLIKYRDRWRLGNIEFEFDKKIEASAINRPTINIGSYLQATIETEHEYTSDEMQKMLWDALERLGFKRTDLCWESYIEIYLKQMKTLKISQSEKKEDI